MTTHELTLRLPLETIRLIEAKIASGMYNTPSDVIAESVLHLNEDRIFDDELRSEILAASAEAKRHPETLLTSEDMRQAIKEELASIRATG